MSFYELQGILIIHIYIQECMQMKVMIGKESEFSRVPGTYNYATLNATLQTQSTVPSPLLTVPVCNN